MEVAKKKVGRSIRGNSIKKLVSLSASAALLVALTFSFTVQAASLYRYINDKGYQEIGYAIPTHLVANGYDVIEESGRLIRRVAAQLSEEEYAAKLERERRVEACEKAMDRVRRRYENLDDIDAAERHYIEQLNESLRNDQSNLEYSYTQLSDREERAARIERSGATIPEDLLDNISGTELQIQTLTAQIEARERGRVEKAMGFAEERRMFQLGDCNPDRLASLR